MHCVVPSSFDIIHCPLLPRVKQNRKLPAHRALYACWSQTASTLGSFPFCNWLVKDLLRHDKVRESARVILRVLQRYLWPWRHRSDLPSMALRFSPVIMVLMASVVLITDKRGQNDHQVQTDLHPSPLDRPHQKTHLKIVTHILIRIHILGQYQ